jgi:DNA mismatch repair ATPase MutS
VGRRLLARHLQAPAEPRQIKERQDAVKELTGKLAFRQSIRAHGMTIDDTSQKLESLYELFKEPFFIKGRKLFVTFIHIFPLITISTLLLMFAGLPFPIPFAFILIQLLFNKAYAKKTARVYRLTSRKAKILKAYSGIIADIENEPFESAELLRLKQDLYLKERNASRYINRLASVMESFDIRSSDILSFLISNTLFWELHCVYRIEKWREETAPVIHQWFNVIAAFESLSSFANVHFNNSRWVFPKIRENRFTLKTTAVGHPLIPQKERVCNNITMEKEGSILMVTGPNMAGKSTFLRTVGVNAVLAQAGAPVCAESFELSPFQLLTSMQTSDSLDKHLSLFYAELQRLKMVLDGVKEGKNAFFMIDEMLKGTNALDRQKGSIVLIKQLAQLRANGIVATHDLELTKLENETPGIANFHFDGYVQDDKLLFDYTLKPGICESFNALALMRKMGIEL